MKDIFENFDIEKKLKHWKNNIGKKTNSSKRNKDKRRSFKKTNHDVNIEALLLENTKSSESPTTPRSRNTVTVLQGYTYFLNACYTSFVSIGFSSEDFSPIVQISAKNGLLGVDSISFTRGAWSKIYANKEFIAERLNTSQNLVSADNIFMNINNNNINDNVKLDFADLNNTKYIVFTQNNVTVTLTNNEFQKLMDLSDFFNTTLIYNNSVQYFIKEYCSRYASSCKNLNVKRMDSTAYTSPMESRPPINYFRLFHEIPYVYENISSYNIDTQTI